MKHHSTHVKNGHYQRTKGTNFVKSLGTVSIGESMEVPQALTMAPLELESQLLIKYSLHRHKDMRLDHQSP